MSTEDSRVASPEDQQLLGRFVDGELADGEAQGLRQRLEREPRLRTALQDLQQLRRGFAAGRPTSFAPPAGFAAGVIAAARRLPPVADPFAPGEFGERLLRCSRRLLIAAAVVFAFCVLWQARLFHSQGDGTLQATPDEASRIIEQLDAGIRAEGAGTGRK